MLLISVCLVREAKRAKESQNTRCLLSIGCPKEFDKGVESSPRPFNVEGRPLLARRSDDQGIPRSKRASKEAGHAQTQTIHVDKLQHVVKLAKTLNQQAVKTQFVSPSPFLSNLKLGLARKLRRPEAYAQPTEKLLA